MHSEQLQKLFRQFFQIAVAVSFGVLFGIMMFQTVTMQENAMEPGITVGDRFFMNKLIYRVSTPARGDLIVFKTSARDDAALHIRRVIGLPGETVTISEGRIYINGELYSEPSVYPLMESGGIASSGIKLESSDYFVLGDNRNNSEDSRHNSIGKINKRYIIGKVWFQISPLREFGFVS